MSAWIEANKLIVLLVAAGIWALGTVIWYQVDSFTQPASDRVVLALIWPIMVIFAVVVGAAVYWPATMVLGLASLAAFSWLSS